MLKPLFPVIDYAVNYNYISNKLCVNITQPELHCNGKYYVSKELAKSSQKDSSPFSKTKIPTQKTLDFYLPAEISEIPLVAKEFCTNYLFIQQIIHICFSSIFSDLLLFKF